jgi:hypothetical protein
MAANEALLAELRAAAATMTRDAVELGHVLGQMAADVERAMAEPLPLFPVIHHCPASALHMVRYLRSRKPKVVFLELCEDLGVHLKDLADCTLPVALQAFAGEVEGHPKRWAPLSVVAPITEMSAEYQAIAYALTTEGVELVLIDRSADHVFQMRERDEDPDAPVDDDELDEEEDDEARLHGGAVGVEVGGLPKLSEFREVLLENARMGRLEEWIALYVEEPTIGADTDAYREVMFLIGSLFRRLGTHGHDRDTIRTRDRIMWTRIHETLAARGLPPEDCVFVCGAAHTANDDVPEFGFASTSRFDIPPRTATEWRYGLIPSSFGAIEAQFGHARGAVSLAEGRWQKALKTWKVTPFTLSSKKKAVKVSAAREPEQLSLQGVLRRPPNLTEADAEELVDWSVRIVKLARDNRYLASTADAIAIYETSILLARMRSRLRPSPYDFIDAAETCLEKGRPPGKKDIRQLCSRLLGGDRVGQVGYDALPPLVQDMYDRLAPVKVTAQTRTVTRILMDFEKRPELRAVSRLLWTLNWLLPGSRVARPIMGERKLGFENKQESWDLCIHGPEQRMVIELSFEGITLEQVLERRLREAAWKDETTTSRALEAAEAALTLGAPPRLASDLGDRAIELLEHEAGADDAPVIFDRARRFVQYFRSTEGGMPPWLERFVATGYGRFASQLPARFADRGTHPDKVAAMLGFVFTLESLALAMGCSRSQVTLALEQAAVLTVDPEKMGLLWAAEWLVQRRDEETLRAGFREVLQNPLGRTAYPRYLSGFLQSLSFAPRLAPIGVELLGRAFSSLPDYVLLPWMPGLLSALQARRGDVLPGLFREALAQLPRSAAEAKTWTPPWETVRAEVATVTVSVSAEEAAVGALLRGNPAAVEAWAVALGVEGGWVVVGAGVGAGGAGAVGAESEVGALLLAFPAAVEGWAGVV